MRVDGATEQSIADTTGLNRTTVHRILEKTVCSNEQTEFPKTITGKDGKQYPLDG
jgi:hypothetical protein